MGYTDIVFIKPAAAPGLYGGLSRFGLPAIEPPLHAALLAALLREQGYSTAVLDPEAEGWGMEETARRAFELEPRLLAVIVAGANPSASTMCMAGARLLLGALRKCDPMVPIVLGGLHPTVLPQRTLEEEDADFVCLGEGFLTLPRLVAAIKAGDTGYAIPGLWHKCGGHIVPNPPAPLLDDLNALPMPAWDLLPMARYRAHNWHCFGPIERRSPYAVIYTTLGCPYHCHFCCTNALFGKAGIRYRAPKNVAKEIDYLVRVHGVRNLKIMDEMFVLNRRHVETLCGLLIERGYDLNIWAYARVNTVNEALLDVMRRAGIRWLVYGFESGSQEVLESVSKGYRIESVDTTVQMTRDAGIHILGNYLFGLPGDDAASMQATLDMAFRINAEWANFYTVMALPGSALYEEALAKGWTLPETWASYSQYAYDCQPLPTEHLTPAQVLAFRDQAFHTYYSNPRYLDMIRDTFGDEAVAHISDMASHTLRRKLTEKPCEER